VLSIRSTESVEDVGLTLDAGTSPAGRRGSGSPEGGRCRSRHSAHVMSHSEVPLERQCRLVLLHHVVRNIIEQIHV